MEAEVSVCVPTYNALPFLAPCLESLRAQTYPHYEVLVVDDCSNDDTVAIAQSYIASDPRFRLIRNDYNLGLVGNWNRCVELSKGRLIKYVFQDDFISPTCIERLVEASRRTGAALTFCFREFAFEDGIPEQRRELYRVGRSAAETLFSAKPHATPREFCRIAVERLDRNFIGEPTSVLLSRNVFEEVGFFNPMLAVSCDSEFWLRVGIRYGVTAVPERLATFRVHDNSVTSQVGGVRGYTVDILDAVITLHQIAFTPQYAPLRAEALRAGLDLPDQFARKAAWAYGVARSARRNGDASLMLQWTAAARKFPRLRSAAMRDSLRKLATKVVSKRWFGRS